MFQTLDLKTEYNNKFTNTLQIANDCNYINPEISNSSDFILSCISKPEIKNPNHYDNCLNASIEVKNEIKEEIIEGLENQDENQDENHHSSDHSTKGAGVSYTPLGSCNDGYIRVNGHCHYKLWEGRHRDGDWQRGHHNETMHLDKGNYSLCGIRQFLGLNEDGHVLCGSKKEGGEGEEVEVKPFEEDTIETFANV